ncbi:LysR family transcriptional regulator [Amycolatopsis jejuensis]|uniref:LysR family transcriptional regulator n=1 Tax=Amycolatopsis jejuensis TaxID=330084 RepID=UPI000527B24D|nr:LysR family transcriptional regulator [Amycolatopsis jejuensis]
MDPTFSQLRAFVCLAEELHLGKAAARLHTSQPSLSHMLKKLEANVGFVLLDRTTRRVSLTTAGEAYAADIRRCLESLDRAQRHAGRLATGAGSILSVGYIEPAAFDLLPGALAAFRKEMPDVELELYEMHAREQLAALRRGELDCAVLRAPVDDPELCHARVHIDRCVLAVSSNYVVESKAVSLTEVADRRFIVYAARTGTGLLKATLDACEHAGFTPEIGQEATSTPMLLALVAAGEGVAVISKALSIIPRPGVQFLDIAGKPVLSDVLLVWRRGEETRAVSALLKCFREVGEA